MIPKSIRQFIELFSRLPSMGPRQATRLVFYLLNLDRSALRSLSESFAGLQTLNRCPHCFFVKEAKETLCAFCKDASRDREIIAIVEKETEVLALERTGQFRGHYLVFGELSEKGVLEPVHKLRLKALKERIRKDLGGKAKEILIALNPTTFGDFAAHLIQEEFKDSAERITRLGRGIPTGGEIEFADEETLRQAFERRT